MHNLSSAWTANINGVWWTLPVEFNYYLALPLLFYLIRYVGIWIFMTGAICFVVLYKVILFPFIFDQTVGYKVFMFGQLTGRIELFGYGMLAAYLYKKYGDQLKESKHKKFIEWGLILGGILGMWQMLDLIHSIGGAEYWKGGALFFVFESIYGFFIFSLVLGVSLSGKSMKVVFANRTALYFGSISYGVYLWHMPFLKLIFENQKIIPLVNGATNHANLMIASSVFAIATIIAASISYRYVEKPFLNIK